MKALTVDQPWASMIAHEIKLIETRSWPTSYRGPLAIHASNNRTPGGFLGFEHIIRSEPFLGALKAKEFDRWWNAPFFPRGAVLAVVELYDVRPTEEIADSVPMNELHFGNFSPGRYAWLLRNVERFPVAIEARGRQRLWEWTKPDSPEENES